MQKTFKFDVIIEEEDMCNREAEKKRLTSLIERNGRVVIYSPRRMGKTSLVNVCSKKIRKKDRVGLIGFSMEVPVSQKIWILAVQ